MADQTKDSLSRAKVEAATENLRKIHDKDVGALLKELRAYHKGIQALNVQGVKLADQLLRFGERSANEWGAAFKQLGSELKEIEAVREITGRLIEEEAIKPLHTQIIEDTKAFNEIDEKMKSTNKEFDIGIQKLFSLAQMQRKKDPKTMLQSMEELTNAVTEVDQKREEMLSELEHAELCRFSKWYKIFVNVWKAEFEFAKRFHTKMQESSPSWITMAEKPTPTTLGVSWKEELQAPSLKKEKDEKRRSVLKKDSSIEIERKDEANSSPPSEEVTPQRKKTLISVFSTLRGKRSKKDEISEPSPKQNVTLVRTKARALYDYQAQRADELDLKEGQIIEVQGKQVDDWWIGVAADGKHGVFPSTFVQEIEEDEANPSPPLVKSDSGRKGKVPPSRSKPKMEGETNSEQPRPAVYGDWEETTTEDGQIYYYNRATGASAWELPSPST